MSAQMARLFEIVHILLNENSITAKKLSEHFEVSIRTIYRDIEALMFAGIPVYSERGKKGGIRLMEDYVVDKSLISEKEQNDILYALQSLKAVNYSNVDKTLTKLSSIFRKKADDWIEVEFSRYGSDDNILFEKIREGILNKKAVKFVYYNTKGEKSERTAEPLKMWFKEKAWYLFAYCREKNDIRQFKIARIKELELTDGHFDKSMNDFNILPDSRKPETEKITVEIDKSQAYRIYDEFCEEDIRVNESGNFEVTSEIHENEWLYGYLLSYGEHLKVLKPDRIKAILSDKINKMQKNHKI